MVLLPQQQEQRYNLAVCQTATTGSSTGDHPGNQQHMVRSVFQLL